MDCKRARDLLSSYMDKKISERDKDLLELHLRDCEDCQEFLQDLRKAVKLVESLEDVQPPADLLADIQESIQKVPEKKGFFQRPLWVRIPVEAFGTVMVVLVIFFFGRFLMQRDVVVVGDVSLQKDKEISSRWLPDESIQDVRERPSEVSEESQEIYEVVERVRKAYRELGISPSEGEYKETELEEADEVKKKEEIKAYSTQPNPVVSWESHSARKAIVTKRAVSIAKPEKLMREYNINIEVEDLSGGVNELITQVYKHKGVFITPPEAGKDLREQASKKQMIFKIPAEKHYQFMWNLEKVGVIKKITAAGGIKRGKEGFITVRLMIDVVSGK